MPSVCQQLQLISKCCNRRLEVLQLRFPPAHAFERLRYRAKHASQSRIGSQGCEKRLRRNQVCGCPLYVLQTEQEDAVALEELAAIGAADAADNVWPKCKPLHESICGIIGGFGRGRIDDRDDLVGPVRKGSIEHPFLLTPWQRAGQELLAVGGHCKVPSEITR